MAPSQVQPANSRSVTPKVGMAIVATDVATTEATTADPVTMADPVTTADPETTDVPVTTDVLATTGLLRTTIQVKLRAKTTVGANLQAKTMVQASLQAKATDLQANLQAKTTGHQPRSPPHHRSTTAEDGQNPPSTQPNPSTPPSHGRTTTPPSPGKTTTPPSPITHNRPRPRRPSITHGIRPRTTQQCWPVSCQDY